MRLASDGRNVIDSKSAAGSFSAGAMTILPRLGDTMTLTSSDPLDATFPVTFSLAFGASLGDGALDTGLLPFSSLLMDEEREPALNFHEALELVGEGTGGGVGVVLIVLSMLAMRALTLETCIARSND
jgi:hypothetical protein